MNLGDRYQLGPVIASQWNEVMAAQFPHASHTGCRQLMRVNETTDMWEPFDPPRCVGYHCPNCGTACNTLGHHHCTNPTHQEENT